MSGQGLIDLSDVGDLTSVLDLEVLDRDLFRGRNADHGPTERHALFGGQVAAQALRAAGHTVDGDRHPHSLHGYFLRRGRTEIPVIYRVERDRDGGSFSARHVRAIQRGEVIFSMLASFHGDEPSGHFERDDERTPPPPEEVEPAVSWDALVETREITTTDEATGRHPDFLWLRAATPLPDDRLTQACGLTYLSDFGSGFGQISIDGLAQGGPSIDHTMWFHEPIAADDWVAFEMQPAKAGGSRGLYTGSMRDRHGRLGALVSQEILLRER